MKKLLQIVLISSLSLCCFSCYYDELPEPVVIDIPDEQEISFAQDIQPIFTSQCISCHNGNINPDLREGNAYGALVPEYVTPGDADNSTLYSYLPGRGTHQPVSAVLTNEEIALIKAWIDRGGANN